MPWNWQLPQWPQFSYDTSSIAHLEKQFLLKAGRFLAHLSSISNEEKDQFIVEILSVEGEKSAKIEGEILERQSLQSSIKKHFGLKPTPKEGEKEARMAKLLCNVYETVKLPLSHEMLWQWHSYLFSNSSHISDRGTYRTHIEPMQIVSNRSDSSKVFFEAPPSKQVFKEMNAFILWFNSPLGSSSILERAAIAHLYFESIHPFEDGNGRIGRALVEKVLSQAVGGPILIAVSKTLERRKKEYYANLESCNRTLDVQSWVDFFAQIILESHEESMQLLLFLISKAKLLSRLEGQLNPRQIKALLRMFAEGPSGFKGGLSAENYISITKATRATATRDLTDLVDKGALIKSGELRYTRYQLNQGLSEN